MNDKRSIIKQTAFMIIGEATVSVIVAVIFELIGKFDYTVITGAVLGSSVMVANYLFLIISVNRALRDFCEKRGTREMEEDEAQRFADENKRSVQLKIQLSFMIRMATIIGCLILALTTKQFNVIATLVPLLMLRPLLMADAYFESKREAKKTCGDDVSASDESDNDTEATE